MPESITCKLYLHFVLIIKGHKHRVRYSVVLHLNALYSYVNNASVKLAMSSYCVSHFNRYFSAFLQQRQAAEEILVILELV